jgi:hypothetical protein
MDTTTVGIGFSEEIDSFKAGEEAAKKAKKMLGNLHPHLLVLFTTSRHVAEKILEGITHVFGSDIQTIIGGYGVGVITTEAFGYDAYQAGVLAVYSETMIFNAFQVPDIHLSEHKGGYEMAKAINDTIGDKEYSILTFMDAVDRSSGKLKMNSSSEYCRGLNEVLNAKKIKLAGAGMTGDMMFRPGYQWYNGKVFQNTAVSLTIENADMDTIILHGCKPASSYHTVTKADGAVILEIDKEPALDFVKRLINNDSLNFTDYGFFLTLAINTGNPYDDYRPEDYAVRMCVNIDRERRGIVMVESDLVEGTEIIFMRRSADFSYMPLTIKNKIEEIKSRGKTPKFAFYVDCAGRAALYFGSDIEDVSVVENL